jgi:hypothetical protein
MVPSDITIVGNHYWKDYAAWYPSGYNVKNIQELKNAQRVLFDGNVFEFNWLDAQNGTAIVFTVRNQNGGCPWCVVQDVTFTHNLIQHAGEGFVTSGSDGSNPSLPENRILIQNNVWTDISSSYNGANGWGGLVESGAGASGGGVSGATANNILVDHNSIFSNASCLRLGDSTTQPITLLQWTNQICLYGTEGGINGTGVTRGLVAFNTYVTTLIANDMLMLTSSGKSDGNQWPSRTFWNTTSGAGFTNYAGSNYQLLTSSPYHNAGTDGRDIGVWDWTTFNAETTNALNGK